MNKSLIIASLSVVSASAFGISCDHARNRCSDINNEVVFLQMRMENRAEQGQLVATGNVFIPKNEKVRKNTRSKCLQHLDNENKFLKATMQKKHEEIVKLKQINRNLNKKLRQLKKEFHRLIEFRNFRANRLKNSENEPVCPSFCRSKRTNNSEWHVIPVRYQINLTQQ